jgi:long-chain acyl-CoA synthetase
VPVTEYVSLLIASAKTGAIFYPLNWRLSNTEIQEVISLADPKMLAVSKGHLGQLEGAVLDQIELCVLLEDGDNEGFISLSQLLHPSINPPVEVSDYDPLTIISTAAVEGVPKGAILTHRNFVSLGDLFIDTFGLTNQDRFLGVLPFFHIAGLNLAIGVAQAGGATVIMDTFDPALGAKMMDEHAVSLLGTFPPMLEMLMAARTQIGATWEHLRFCFGILNPPDVVKNFLTDVGAEYWTGYGQTETTGIATMVNVVEKPGSAGKVVPLLKLRCVNDLGEDVPTGEPGEIAVQGALVFAGYWRDEDATNYTSRYGWHHTGDIGKLDSEGYLYYVGRKPEKELIKSGGENIYPAEVEHAIRELPEVAEVCVIGVFDEKWGESVKAVVELLPGRTLDADQIIKGTIKRIASYKKPQHVEFVEHLPRLQDGEIDRNAVKVAHSG